MTHELKTLPKYFDAIVVGEKTFEVRRDDRGFQKGHRLLLRKYGQTHSETATYPLMYTGEHILVEVVYLLRGEDGGEQVGIAPGFVVLGIRVIQP